MTTDHLGSPRVITNQIGNVTSRKDYGAFGDETLTAQRTQGLGYQPANIRQDYTGYQKDDESGLEYAEARYYNSSHGRFTSVDPLTASATIRDPQTFNRYSYVMNSPYKFSDPLGLLPASATCNFRCRITNAIENGTGLSKDDIALAQFHIANGTALGYSFLNAVQTRFQQQVNSALAMVRAGNELIQYAANITQTQQQQIRSAFEDILANGKREAQAIAVALVNSFITIDAGTGAGQTGVSNVTGLNNAIAAGGLSEGVALSYIGITFDSQEISKPENLQGLILHEGNHALVQARILSTLSTGDRNLYENETRYNDEVRAKSTAGRYLMSRGGSFATFGTSIGLLDPSGKKVSLGSFVTPAGTLQDYFKAQGVIWKQ